jgi:formate hydrogenlyase subunit 5
MSATGRGEAEAAAIRHGSLAERMPAALRDGVRLRVGDDETRIDVDCESRRLRDFCRWLVRDLGYVFATLVAEETAAPAWLLSYLFYDPAQGAWAWIHIAQELDRNTVPSISDIVHAADWHEREAEDLFGLAFEGHPRLGEFILHEDWPEGTNPMRKAFDARRRIEPRGDVLWQPPTVVEAPGAFAMPIGPVFSDFAESAHFLLETVGEDVITAIPRFFYKYRGVEKIAERQTPEDVLLLAERFSGTSAFAHGLAFCQAVEEIAGAEPPPRARVMRSLFAELERLRHHAAAIKGICESTALAVATSQAALIEEDLLRLSGAALGHRYLFGLLKPGGLTLDLADDRLRSLADDAQRLLVRLTGLEAMLQYTSSFLDRLEEVGLITGRQASDYALVGPVARASGIPWDLRKIFSYAAYRDLDFEVPTETEGDGYARLRVLFREAEQSAALIRQAARDLPAGPVSVPFEARGGIAVGATEAPIGAAFHWVRLDAHGKVERYRLSPPSFVNWHGFHLAAENFAFQDFPIILASLGLSNAECDR